MKSGLEGRNNIVRDENSGDIVDVVSMKSGLEGRNNAGWFRKGALTRWMSQ